MAEPVDCLADRGIRRPRPRSPAHVSAPQCPGRSRRFLRARVVSAKPLQGPRRQAGCSAARRRPRAVREGPTVDMKRAKWLQAVAYWAAASAFGVAAQAVVSGSRPPDAHRVARSSMTTRLPPRRWWPRSAGRPRRRHPAGTPSGSRRMAHCSDQSPRRPHGHGLVDRGPWPPRSRRARRRPVPRAPRSMGSWSTVPCNVTEQALDLPDQDPWQRVGRTASSSTTLVDDRLTQPPPPHRCSLPAEMPASAKKRSRPAAGMVLPRPVLR